MNDFEILNSLGFPGYWDALAEAYWIYNGSEFWSYDNDQSILNRMDYIKSNDLRGEMLWELSGDDPEGTLINAIGEGLR